ncbi:hypothetical protein CWB60_12900 [Pseudoalteromonas sp. S327]|nr:hypothetical protein CWB60_12900 [Pseudoalteromonas sp. S327]TMO13575.1 hypothetical protein CWB59_19475 [Pseudoalteromonas sp. S326]
MIADIAEIEKVKLVRPLGYILLTSSIWVLKSNKSPLQLILTECEYVLFFYFLCFFKKKEGVFSFIKLRLMEA